MSAATQRVVALADGNPDGKPSSALHVPVRRTRAHARTSVADSDGLSSVEGGRARAVLAAVGADVGGSWLLRDNTPSIAQTWNADYSALIPGDYQPFALWCRMWRYPAVAVCAVLSAAIWLLIHPLRGPLTITVTAAAVTAICFG